MASEVAADAAPARPGPAVADQGTVAEPPGEPPVRSPLPERPLVRRPDVDYVSVKVSAVASQLSTWDTAGSRDRVVERLRPLYRTAAAHGTFLNLDMEEYRDLALTMAVFTGLLDTPEFAAMDAGIVLQAYLPDALAAMQSLQRWAAARRRCRRMTRASVVPMTRKETAVVTVPMAKSVGDVALEISA